MLLALKIQPYSGLNNMCQQLSDCFIFFPFIITCEYVKVFAQECLKGPCLKESSNSYMTPLVNVGTSQQHHYLLH